VNRCRKPLSLHHGTTPPAPPVERRIRATQEPAGDWRLEIVGNVQRPKLFLLSMLWWAPRDGLDRMETPARGKCVAPERCNSCNESPFPAESCNESSFKSPALTSLQESAEPQRLAATRSAAERSARGKDEGGSMKDEFVSAECRVTNGHDAPHHPPLTAHRFDIWGALSRPFSGLGSALFALGLRLFGLGLHSRGHSGPLGAISYDKFYDKKPEPDDA
jgi:hypothetical protein